MMEAARKHRERLERIAGAAFHKPAPAPKPEPKPRAIAAVPIVALPPRRCLDAIPETAVYVPWVGEDRPVTFSDIKLMVAKHFRMTFAELESDRRNKAVVRPRQIAMWLAKKTTAMSLPAIGRRLGDRDHTTVLHGIRKIERLIATDENLAELCSAFIRNLEGTS